MRLLIDGINALSQEICPEKELDCALAYGVLVRSECATDHLKTKSKLSCTSVNTFS